MSRSINQDCWNEYYRFWDEFVKKWFDQRPNIPNDDGISDAYVRFIQFRDETGWKQLNLDILPTPYLGSPDKGVCAVVMHQNPGLSEIASRGDFAGESTDATQSYTKIEEPIGWLIRKFRDDAKCSYRDFLSSWSCLKSDLGTHNPQVCGWDWWRSEMKWIRRVYGNSSMPSDRVFALELCPYHSKNFGIRKEKQFYKNLLGFIREYVIDKAIVATLEGELPYAVALGASFYRIFDVLKFPYVEWPSEHCETHCEWPPNSKGNATHRWYRLYTAESTSGEKAKILVTWVQAPGNPSPGENFAAIETEIRNYAIKSTE